MPWKCRNDKMRTPVKRIDIPERVYNRLKVITTQRHITFGELIEILLDLRAETLNESDTFLSK
jgi:macrodomain Ter protein organizer (MatP/YcbG family)